MKSKETEIIENDVGKIVNNHDAEMRYLFKKLFRIFDGKQFVR